MLIYLILGWGLFRNKSKKKIIKQIIVGFDHVKY